MIYSYEAKDGAGRTVTGSLDADDERAAAALVREQGYFPMRLVPQAHSGGGAGPPPPEASRASARTGPQAPAAPWLMARVIYPIWPGVGLDELSLFFRQFAAMLRAGVPVFQCLSSLLAQTRNPAFRKCLHTFTNRVQSGDTLSAAMSQYPWIFTDFHRAMVAAGETSGRLDLMFARLADSLEQEQTMRRAIRRETTYPKIVLSIAFLMCLFLLPKLALIIAALLALAPVLFAFSRLGQQAKGFYHGLIANMPGVGGTVRMIALARFARTLASLFAAGVVVPKALQSAAESCGNAYIGGRIMRAAPRITAGDGITEALQATGVFPPMVVSMLGTGEQTGSLDFTMDKVAEFYEAESVVRLHQACIALGVVALIIAGAVVFTLALNFYGGAISDTMKADPE